MDSRLGEGEEDGSWREMHRQQKQLEQRQEPLQGDDDDDGSSGLVEIEMSTFPLDGRRGAEGGLGRLPSLPLTLSCLQYQQGVAATTTRPSSARASCYGGAADVGTAASSPPDDEGLDSTKNNNDPTPLPIVSEPESATASTASASRRTPSQDTSNSSSTCSSSSSCDDGEDDDSANTPSDLYRMRDITAGADNSPAPVAGLQATAPMSSATGGDCCCCLCGYTLEEGKRVVRSPECGEGLMVHEACFESEDSTPVFNDDSDGGALKFGCDCGQFHPGVGLTAGVYALSLAASDALVPSETLSRAGAPGAGAKGWVGGDAGAMVSPRDGLRERAREEALEACPTFVQQADPQALAVVDGEVRLRPVNTPAMTPTMLPHGLSPDGLAERFSRQDVLSRAEAEQLLRQGTEVLDKEDNVLELEGETVVVGDLHGQFFDLLTLLKTYGEPPERQYLFLGDYVDRGLYSCEVALYLVSLKLAFPREVHLIRGNHETANQTATCGFKDECSAKYGSRIYDAFLECFSALPVCAILSQKGQLESLFCVHGGISPRLKTVNDI
ncbi:unnamed protein product, partial [Ectocarpus sp. 12 AP-2014]